ncbi:MAG: c-type cytochrome [Planctomycetota bacterium]|jgi:mono/diheme cytochrome c family protein
MMLWTTRFGLAVVSGLFLLGSGCEQKPADPLEVVYAKRCAYCHKLNGNGTASFPPLRQPYLKTPALTRIILHGMKGPIQVDGKEFDREMVGLGETLSDAEVTQVVLHCQNRFGGGAEDIDEKDIAAIRKATAGRDGPFTAPELAPFTK